MTDITDEDRRLYAYFLRMAGAAEWVAQDAIKGVDDDDAPLAEIKAFRLAAEARGAERERARVDAKAIAHDVVQSVCETDPADPENPNTVLVAMQDLYDIVQAEIDAALSRHADQGDNA